MRKVLLLGASGSIGTQTLDILRNDRASFELNGFSVGKRTNIIPSVISSFPTVKFICVQREEDCLSLEKLYPNISFYWGDEGLKSIIRSCPCDMVVNALVGFAGLVPSVTSLKLGKILCLANKESLVVGGALVNQALKENGGHLYPIDSEHVAIGKLLRKVNPNDVDKIFITASGGSFRSLNRKQLKGVTKEQALAHPTWSMGAKITIDSATMFNKGFEVVEAKWLYDFPLSRTRVIMHDESNVHSFLLLKDGTIVADVSKPDMHGPIAYALYEGNIDYEVVKAKDLSELGPFHFHVFDPKRYPAVNIVVSSYKIGGTAPSIVNAANEEAVYAFLEGKIKFLDIEKVVKKALKGLKIRENPTLEEIIASDKEAREYARKVMEK